MISVVTMCEAITNKSRGWSPRCGTKAVVDRLLVGLESAWLGDGPGITVGLLWPWVWTC